MGARARNTSSPVMYVALGDSTGVGDGARNGGYVARIFTRIERERPASRLTNLCVSGAETRDVLRDQLPRMNDARPTLITLGIGINDVTHGVETEQFARNLEEIITRLRERTDAPIVVTNLPDISYAPGVPPYLRAQLRQRLNSFNERIAEIATRHRLRLVDIYSPSHDTLATHSEHFSTDGFHPSDAGYEFWAATMWPTIKSVIDG